MIIPNPIVSTTEKVVQPPTITHGPIGPGPVIIRIEGEKPEKDDVGDNVPGILPTSVEPGRRLSEGERLLLEALAELRSPCAARTGRFLTLHKRRRRRLSTRSLNECPALLDDLHHGNVKCVLDRVWQWPFNAFTLDTATGGRSLPVLCVHLFHWYGLMDHFNLDVVRIWKFFSLVEEGYHSTNPYHNAIHATDVTQAMHCFLQEKKIREHLSPLEILSALIAAVTHDLDHPGVNQPFLIATSNHLAALYSNTSVLENHHWRSAIGCLLESHLAEEVASVRPELEKQIASLILATDITRQQEFLAQFKNYLDGDSLDMRRPEHRHFILQIALKCADISNPCRPWEISKKWSLKVCEEFFRQGDYERQLNLPVTNLCDRFSTSVPKIQTGFFRFVVEPLYIEWNRFLNTPLSQTLMRHLKRNQTKWESLQQQEVSEETRTEISEAEEAGSDPPTEPQPRRLSLLTVPRFTSKASDHRRHSVPISMTIHLQPRRESLPDPQRRATLGPMLDEDDELSLVSSCSSVRSKSGSYTEERPVSSEALVPDLSIASMTSSGEAQRLSSILQGNAIPLAPQTGRLTRQQTFPPLQQPTQYVRQRYLSATGDMRGSSSSDSSGGDRCGETKPLLTKEKENVDPTDAMKCIRKQQSQVLWKRRKSEPVGLPPYEAPVTSTSSIRRGSVPADTATILIATARPQRGDEERRKRRASKKSLRRRSSGGPETFRQKEASTRRRGSLPIEFGGLTSSASGRNLKDTMRH
ncbi:cAMP-specific 3,5-cyclic phosphodiesterase [Nesidiocoris tenuis]|uniref:Phosphodiesterase n=1 Tax=Nesidiocoris tenuis TaxID=355587 RepID=A0ABN7B6L7_9HEMI|nr:cAMP-specific 3,5-cyclic phosphodiesterase [Nesidiocoris tenuis]